MSYKEELIKHYIDQDLQVTVDRDPTRWSTGNGLLHNGVFLCLLYGAEQLEESDIARFNASVALCEDGEGVYDRNRGRNDQNAHDDATGVAAGSAIGELKYHKDILNHGLKHFFTYENVDHSFDGLKDLWAFRLRFPFIVLWYFLINKKLRLLTPIFLLFLLTVIFDSRADSKIMKYCMLESLAKTCKCLRMFRNIWLSLVNLPRAMREYFNKEGQPEHPIVGLSTELKEL